jgi:hypothetical protein
MEGEVRYSSPPLPTTLLLNVLFSHITKKKKKCLGPLAANPQEY